MERSVCVGAGGKMVTGGTRWSVPAADLDLVVGLIEMPHLVTKVESALSVFSQQNETSITIWY